MGALAPFRHPAYAVMWSATLVANIGVWMYAAAAGWLMTELTTDPLLVSLVQVAATLPMFLLALPAGALADIVDKRLLLIIVESAIVLLAGLFAALVWLEMVTPARLLVLTFLVEAGAAFAYPAWQSVVPQLVPRADLPLAVAANSVGINASRAIGPALGGALTVGIGLSAPFWLNAFANLSVIGALLWWRPAAKRGARLPAERFVGALRSGLRYARNSSALRATLRRAAGFFIFASAYWALLPLVARTQIGGGPALYGILLGAVGAGAIGGALVLPWLRARLGSDGTVSTAAAGTALALVLFGVAREPWSALAASLIAGVSWIAAVANLNVSAQFALPEWVRGRGLALYVTVFFGAMTLGAGLWGQVAALAGVPGALFSAAAGALVAIALTRRWKLQTAAGADLTPSMHWPAPVVSGEVEHDAGPVMVTIEYQVDAKNRGEFLDAVELLSRARRRDGAYAWGVFEDVARPGRFLETFVVESWLEHLRQHERATNADRVLEEGLRRLSSTAPVITHLIAPA